jgi:hypothetical protein
MSHYVIFVNMMTCPIALTSYGRGTVPGTSRGRGRMIKRCETNFITSPTHRTKRQQKVINATRKLERSLHCLRYNFSLKQIVFSDRTFRIIMVVKQSQQQQPSIPRRRRSKRKVNYVATRFSKRKQAQVQQDHAIYGNDYGILPSGMCYLIILVVLLRKYVGMFTTFSYSPSFSYSFPCYKID